MIPKLFITFSLRNVIEAAPLGRDPVTVSVSVANRYRSHLRAM